ncbi:MAG: hypothetical protein HZA93_10465 [Verrucomicrobia bacterium]|nr:hypothetical protein [Verrucomicrobiota bacterium]
MSRDSNIYASADNAGDMVYSTSLSVTYQRRAGWIGVNAGVSVGASRFGKHTSENFSNPSYSLELNKKSGRTTGALSLGAARESRADSAVNLRNTSWNYNASLNVKYPMHARSTLTGGLGYASHKYVDTAAFANLSTYSGNLNFIYLLPAERDLVTGYRYRYSETSRDTTYTDHSGNVGLSGKLIYGLNGSINAGYQLRVPHGITAAKEGTFHSWTGSGSVTYPINRKLSLSGSLAKDFSTTATDASVDSLNADLSLQYAYDRKWSASANVGWGDSRFLGESGRIILAVSPEKVLGPHRHDNFLTWGATLNYARSERLKMMLGYSWFQSWSTSAFADFRRTNWTFSTSSHW